MNNISYLIIHKDHPMAVGGIGSGAEMATRHLARFIARRGVRVIVCAQLLDEEQTLDGVEYWDLGAGFDVGSALKRAREIGPYHIISAGRALPIFQSVTEANCVSRSLISHDRSGNDTGIRPAVLAEVVDNIICVSHAQSQIFLEHEVPADKVHVIHNGVDLDLFSSGVTENRDYMRLVFVGALIQDKGIQLLIPSFAELKQRYPSLKLDVYGSAALWGREKFFDEEELARQIPDLTFHGSVTQEVVSEAFQTAGICVVPSIWFDPFPLTSIEAQVTGCPVVTFDVGGLKEGLRHQETGIVLQDISQEALTKCLDGLLGDENRLRSMSTRALETARPYFTWERVAESVMELCARSESPLPVTQKTNLLQKRVGYLSTWNQECGLATYARYMLQAFEEGSYIVLGEETDSLTREDEPFVERCWKRGSADFEKLFDAVARHDIGLLHINAHYRFFPQPAFTQCIEKLQREGVEVVVSLHSAFTLDESLIGLVTSADCVLTHSKEVRLEVIANGASPEKVKVVPHGVDVKQRLSDDKRRELKKQLGMEDTELSVVSFGFIQPHKGLEGLIEGVAHTVQRGLPVRGYIAGKVNEQDPHSEQYLKDLKQLAQLRGVADRITFLDRFISQKEVTQYLQAADVVLMNYQSGYFEASGACALAVGAGAVVATSCAPPFMEFGDAVWHITQGYPAPLSLELLLTQRQLREEILLQSARYVESHSWQRVYERLLTIYRDLGFVPEVLQEENVVSKDTRGTADKDAQSTLNVLMQNRPGTFTQRGGDTVVMEKSIEALERRGVNVTVDLDGTMDPKQFDLVHLFNYALPELTKRCAERAKAANVPYVVTTLCEDVPRFHNQSIEAADWLIGYVNNGQSESWSNANRPDFSGIAPCVAFDNEWTTAHASALLTNGTTESDVIRNSYAKVGKLVEVQLGHEIGSEGDPRLFTEEYGVTDFVLCVGRLESRKNQLMLLKALEDSELPIVLVAGGFTYQPQYDKAVRNFSRKGKTIVTGRLSPEMLASAFAAARVHVLPSWYELPGLVSLEAASHGCNVVGTRYGTTPDYFGKHAFYCDPSDEDSIKNAVLAGYYSPFKEELRREAQSFTWDSTGEKTLAVYQDVLGAEVGVPQEAHSGTTYEPTAIVIPETHTLRDTIVSSAESSENSAPDSYETEDTQEVLEKAEMAARHHEYETAHRLFKEVLLNNPDSARALRGRGAVFLAENDIAQAKLFFDDALKGNALDPKTLSGAGICLMKQGDTAGAYDLFVRALECDPLHLVTLLQLVDCSYVLERYDDLAMRLEYFVKQQPENLDMQYCLSGAYYKQGRLKDALGIVEVILKELPSHKGATELKAKIAEQETEGSASVPTETPHSMEADGSAEATAAKIASSAQEIGASLSSLIAKPTTEVVQTPGELNPSSVASPPSSETSERRSPLQSQIAVSSVPVFGSLDQQLLEIEDQKRLKEFDKVMQGCEKVLSASHCNSQQRERATLIKAEVDVLTGNIERAETVFRSVLEKNPQSVRALCGQGALLAHHMQWGEAREIFERARSIDDSYDIAYAGLGLCHSWEKDNESAWQCYMEALKRNPESHRALLGVVELSYILGKHSELENVLSEYLELHPCDLDFVYALAGCLFAQERFDDAQRELDKVTLFEPDHEKAHELRKLIDEKRIEEGSGVHS